MKPRQMSPRNPIAAVLPQAAVFVTLVAIGVVGRWGQPDWCVTPLAAVGLLAGYALPRAWAVATPLAAMLITDLALPGYGSTGLALAVYAAMAVPALLGGLLRSRVANVSTGVARLIGLAAMPALIFFVVTNLAVWATSAMYPATLVGLAECYAAATPFLRRMLAGDLAFTGVLFAAAWIAGSYSFIGQPANAKTESVTAS